MAIDWKVDDNNLLVFSVSGILGKQEFENVQKECEPLIQKDGSMNLLVVMENFGGWEQVDGWEDMSFSDRNDPFIKKMAIVCESRWHDSVYLFTAADLRSISIKYFTPEELDVARQWLDG